MLQQAHKATKDFEAALEKYTGAPYAVAVDSCTNALFLSLTYSKAMSPGLHLLEIPARTYPSVPCSIIQAGMVPDFVPWPNDYLKGAYPLSPSRVWDAALRFTHNMYRPDTYMCLSFTGPHKHLSIGKGGAILTDDWAANCWFRRARYSGRREISYLEDTFDQRGWNMWLLPELAVRGLSLMNRFYGLDGKPLTMEDKELPYPDLSQYDIYNRGGI